MKKYIGTKEVEAMPMTLGEADKKMLVSSSSKLSKDEKNVEGYHVKFGNGIKHGYLKTNLKKHTSAQILFLTVCILNTMICLTNLRSVRLL